jgi:acyl-CoA reductase-like NAD-dependent aldehyde dehydrogenase
MILELGGNDPAIVLRDADVDKTAKGIFEGSMINCGQICCGIKRVYVHESIIEPFTAKLAELAKDRVKLIGAGSNPSVKLGPLNNEMQFKRVSELVEDAVKNGASLVAGGKKPAHVDQNGYFYEPTVLVNVKEGMRIVDEEQFGPIIPVLSYQSDDEVIQRANATKYGLGASVWGSDPEYVNSMAKKVLAGTVWTNEHAADGPGLPFGGFRESGIGREGGDYDLLTYTECQSVKLLRK